MVKFPEKLIKVPVTEVFCLLPSMCELRLGDQGSLPNAKALEQPYPFNGLMLTNVAGVTYDPRTQKST
jgi:hypothetical protein